MLLIGVRNKPDPLEMDLFQKVLFCHLNYFSQSTPGQLSVFYFFTEHCMCWDSAYIGPGSGCCIIKCWNVLELERATGCVRAEGVFPVSCHPKG